MMRSAICLPCAAVVTPEAGSVHLVMLECSPRRPACAMAAPEKNNEARMMNNLFFIAKIPILFACFPSRITPDAVKEMLLEVD
jgi:hypothetical protein